MNVNLAGGINLVFLHPRLRVKAFAGFHLSQGFLVPRREFRSLQSVRQSATDWIIGADEETGFFLFCNLHTTKIEVHNAVVPSELSERNRILDVQIDNIRIMFAAPEHGSDGMLTGTIGNKENFHEAE